MVPEDDGSGRRQRRRRPCAASAASQGRLHPAEPVHAGGAVRRLLRDRDGDERTLRTVVLRRLLRDGARQSRRPRRGPHDPHPERLRRRDGQPVRHGQLRRRAGADRLRMGAQGAGQGGLGHRVLLLRLRGVAAGALQHQPGRGGQALLPGAAQPGRGGAGDGLHLGRGRHASAATSDVNGDARARRGRRPRVHVLRGA